MVWFLSDNNAYTHRVTQLTYGWWKRSRAGWSWMSHPCIRHRNEPDELVPHQSQAQSYSWVCPHHCRRSKNSACHHLQSWSFDPQWQSLEMTLDFGKMLDARLSWVRLTTSRLPRTEQISVVAVAVVSKNIWVGVLSDVPILFFIVLFSSLAATESGFRSWVYGTMCMNIWISISMVTVMVQEKLALLEHLYSIVDMFFFTDT